MTAPGLHWPVRRSFTRYLARMGGSCSVTDGADLRGHTFRWRTGDVTVDGDRTSVGFHGDVRFSAHGGALFVVLTDPVLDVAPDGSAVLTVHTHLEGRATRVPLASSITAPGPLDNSWACPHPLLTEDGSAVFGGVYAAGAPLSDLVVHTAVGTPHPPIRRPLVVAATAAPTLEETP